MQQLAEVLEQPGGFNNLQAPQHISTQAVEDFVFQSQAEAFLDSISTDSPMGYVAYDERPRLPDVDIGKLIAGMDRQEVIHRCMVDMNFMSKFFMPTVCKDDFPELMDSVWRMWVDAASKLVKYRGEFKTASAIPRGYAKTTLIKLFIIWLILYTPHTFIAIIGSTDSNAENIASDVVEMLGQSHVRAVFGNWDSDVRRNSKEERSFKFMNKTVILKPKGALTSVRGLNIFNKRPDVIIMDDVETAEVAASVAESAKLVEWVFSTLVPTISSDGGLVMFIGNVYPYPTSLLHIIKKMPSWTKLILGAILSDGSSLWENLHSKRKTIQAYLDAVVQGTVRAWLAQYMNAVEDETLNQADLQAIASYGREVATKIKGVRPDVQYLIIDPATDKKDADDTCLLHVEVYQTLVVCRRTVLEVLSPKETIRRALNMCAVYSIPVVFIEDVQYQYTLGQWMREALNATDLKGLVDVMYVAPKRTSKNSRINLSFKELNAAEVIVHPDLYPKYRAEAKKFDPNRKDNRDNLLDTAHYAPIIYDRYKNVLASKQSDYYLKQLEKSSRTRDTTGTKLWQI